MNKATTGNGIRNIVVAITTIFTVLIGLLVSAGGYFIYSRYMENSAVESAETNLLFLADYIDNELDNIDQLITYCKSSSDITVFIESQKNSGTRKYKAYESLNEYCTNNSASNYLHRVVITNLFDNYIQVVGSTYSSTINIAQTLSDQDFYNTLIDNNYKPYISGFTTDPFYPRKTFNIVPVLKPISYKYNSNLGGYIFIEVDARLFLDAFANSYHDDMGILMLNLGEHTYIYENNSFTELTEPLSDDYQIITEPLSRDGCSVSLALSRSQAAASLKLFVGMLALIVIVLIILTTFLNKILSYVINTPVDMIRNKLIKISDGDFSRDTSIEWNNELGEIGRGVNDLAESVGQLNETRIENEKQKKDLEYKMLQSQINPHFIYNTLNSIKFMAATQGATGIADMTTSLARLLKSISKGTKLLIPISEELALVNDYFTIQKYRYGGTINMENDIDENLLDCQIIKFTLQPLVENAIFHGIEPTGNSGTIHLRLFEQNENVVIEITDDGVGMSEEKAKRILVDSSESPSEFFKEIGVSNVHKRLQYEFGENYGISIESKVGVYTTMRITIPKSYERT